MKKVLIKELDKAFLGIDLMLYCVYFVTGYIMIGFPEVEILKPIEYSPVLFFMFGLFSLIAYFLNRRTDNYEYLFLGLINVIVASFILTAIGAESNMDKTIHIANAIINAILLFFKALLTL